MRGVLLLAALLGGGCGPTWTDQPPAADPAPSGVIDDAHTGLCPTAGGGGTKLVAPRWEDVLLCPGADGQNYPMRCAVCSLGDAKLCIPACNSDSNRCTVWTSSGVCSSPANGTTSTACRSPSPTV